MNLDDFSRSLDGEAPPEELDLPLKALWHDAKGHWEHAHDLVQDEEAGGGAWVHAYLHRKEGDEGNARYWYTRARQPVPRESLDEEWRVIARVLLAQR